LIRVEYGRRPAPESAAAASAKVGIITEMDYEMPVCVKNVDVGEMATMVMTSASADEGLHPVLDRYFDALLNKAMAEHKYELHRYHVPATDLIKARNERIQMQILETETALSELKQGKKRVETRLLETYLDALRICNYDLSEIINEDKIEDVRQNDEDLFNAMAGQIIAQIQTLKEQARLEIIARLLDGVRPEVVVKPEQVQVWWRHPNARRTEGDRHGIVAQNEGIVVHIS
jgi:hypothetical protein